MQVLRVDSAVAESSAVDDYAERVPEVNQFLDGLRVRRSFDQLHMNAERLGNISYAYEKIRDVATFARFKVENRVHVY